MADDSTCRGEKPKRGPYKPVERTRLMSHMRELILDGQPYKAIMEQLHMPEKTFYRYLSAIFAVDRRLLVENVSADEIMNQVIICRDRLLAQRHRILEDIANNKAADFKSCVAAHHLAGEISAIVLKLYSEGPLMVASRQTCVKASLKGLTTMKSKLELSKNQLHSTIPYGTKGYEEQEEYDELDEEKCEE